MLLRNSLNSCEIPEGAIYPVRSVVVADAQVFALAQVVQAFCRSWRRCLSGTRATDRQGTTGGYSPNCLL